MAQIQLAAHLTLQVTRKTEWARDLLIEPVLALEESAPDKPGKMPGDLLLISSEANRLLVSLGLAEKLNAGSIRKAGKAAARWLTDHRAVRIGIHANTLDKFGIENALEAFCEGLLLGAFNFDKHKTKDNKSIPVAVHVLTEGDHAQLQERLFHTATVVGGVNLAREWSHEPPNIINPVTLGERAKALASASGLKCTVLGEKELTEMGAGAIISVGLGSKTPSQMIILEHSGNGTQANTPPVVVVGKAITFDTGGYSLKNTTNIVGMKFDKCGGMTVIGVMQAVAELGLPVPVVGIIAAAENMISNEAYRPNDIITSLSGKTIEIISTDAEGRMVLADALTYASTQYKPRAIIDLATLTGGVRVALGGVRAGLMSNDDNLADELFDAGERTHERLWRMPLDEEYFELIKGTDSDIKNSAGVPSASPIVGGTFLKQFVPDEIPWAHIDIAGTATVEKTKGIRSATGFGVRLVLEFLSGI
ncbi:MAG: leucyl aminopeptidase family protein [Anaerolineales bacterium]|nr:leucyl aminopeptidase family protein [Chloroflexota bacterium]MBL7163765.1 leucyl aminopeptidase family protein [Anaerolineales bacterium]